MASSQPSPGLPELAPPSRQARRYYRWKTRKLAYANLDPSNGGAIRDLSEGGVAIQSVSALGNSQRVPVRFELLNPPARVDAIGRVAWSDESGQAGLEFVGLNARSQRQLKDWIFTQLLAAVHEASGTDSIFVHRKADHDATELRFSAGTRAPIFLESSTTALPVAIPVSVPVPRAEGMVLSARSLAGLVDSLILLSSVLLFAVVAVALTSLFPTWTFALGLALGVTTLFAAVYWFLFVVWIGTTPGERLARLACKDSDRVQEEEDQPRFR